VEALYTQLTGIIQELKFRGQGEDEIVAFIKAL